MEQLCTVSTSRQGGEQLRGRLEARPLCVSPCPGRVWGLHTGYLTTREPLFPPLQNGADLHQAEGSADKVRWVCF